MKEDFDIERLEDVKVDFGKEAFNAKGLHCDRCNKKTKPVKIEIHLPKDYLSVKINVFRCGKCKKEYLDFKEAKKLDRALVLSRLMGFDSYKIKRALSFDGDNYIFRIPVDIVRSLGKEPYAEMTPLSSRDLLIHLNKN